MRGREMLRKQHLILDQPEDNMFSLDNEDVSLACSEHLLFEDDDDEDDIDISD